MEKQRILILGVSGMLGYMLFKRLSENPNYIVSGTTRTTNIANWFNDEERKRIRNGGGGIEAENFDSIIRVIASAKPTHVINCIGIIKQLWWSKDPLASITVNAQFPHRLSMLCASAGAKLIHISTDCVYDGSKGDYTESDACSAKDLYGMTKYLGEVSYPHCVTLRTSIIGHEIRKAVSLVDWFLGQENKVKGFTKAIYTGFPTCEIAAIIERYLINQTIPGGLYHVSSDKISKYELLKIIAEVYNKKIDIEPCEDVAIDRSLNSTKFRDVTGYVPPDWNMLIQDMHDSYGKYYS